MELRELAERILFGSTLEAKLWRPSGVTDVQPGVPILAPATPGRPPGLGLRDKVDNGFPTSQDLERVSERGRALGFFANHELLALELLALALLRFPDAPPSFRQDLLATIRDEQRHLQMYLERMGELECVLGEHGLSGFFWRMLSGAGRPEQLISGLSMCLEQANLDHAVRYRRLFEQVGDKRTSAILEQVLLDEISHVRRGLQWVRNWKNTQESDWEAWIRMLPSPLTPARARAGTVRRGPRLAAGIDLDFIVRLETWGQDKGRPPRVWTFNPEMEEAVRGKSPSRASIALRKDQQALMLFLASPTDVVQVDHLPRPAWLDHLRRAGVRLPRFRQDLVPPNSICHSIQPWGWTPELIEQALASQPIVLPPCQKEHLWPASSKLHALACTESWLQRERTDLDPDGEWLAPDAHLGRPIRSIQELHIGLTALSNEGWRRAVLKSPIGTAGRGQKILDLRKPTGFLSWAERVLQDQGGLRLEPWLDRVFDFSSQLELHATAAPKLIGHCQFLSSSRGQFEGAVVGRFAQYAPPKIRRLLFEESRLKRLGKSLENIVPKLMGTSWLEGPLGIDHFVYRCPQGRFLLRPLLECNPRYTMGRIALQLGRLIEPGQMALWRWIPCSKLAVPPQELGTKLLASPLKVGPSGRLYEGIICTNDPSMARLHIGALSVGQNPTLCDWAFRPLLDGGRTDLPRPQGEFGAATTVEPWNVDVTTESPPNFADKLPLT